MKNYFVYTSNQGRQLLFESLDIAKQVTDQKSEDSERWTFRGTIFADPKSITQHSIKGSFRYKTVNEEKNDEANG